MQPLALQGGLDKCVMRQKPSSTLWRAHKVNNYEAIRVQSVTAEVSFVSEWLTVIATHIACTGGTGSDTLCGPFKADEATCIGAAKGNGRWGGIGTLIDT